MPNVLIVDEEEHLLSALEQNLFPDRGDIKILTATNGEQGLEHLRNSKIDLLISDIKMPGKIDGFQLILRAKEVAPEARVIIITAFGSHRVQNFADRIGITHYIEKPFNTDDLREAVLEILDEREGFQGVLNDLELTDIIQMLCLARRTALLHLKYRDHRGRIVFDNGDVTHAEFDDLVGEGAVYRMLALRQGDIFMQSDFRNDQRTIEIGWQDLLFEGVRRADEERANIEPSEVEEEPDATTDIGMGISESDVQDILTAATSEPGASFFSEDELAEIAAATVEDSEADLPFASLSEASDDAFPDGGIGVANARSDPSSSDSFQSPFRRQRSTLTGGLNAPDSEVMTRAIDVEPEPEYADVADLPEGELQGLIESFANDCPGLLHTSIVGSDGTILAATGAHDGFDHETFALHVGELASCARSAVGASADEIHGELQVAVDVGHLVVRSIEHTDVEHVTLVGRNSSLGVSLVMMRRLQRNLLDRLEESV